MDLFSEYKAILEKEEEWNPSRRSVTVDISNLFEGSNAYNFVFELMFEDSGSRPLLHCLNAWREMIPHVRLNHAASLYFMGIMLARCVGYEKFALPIWDEDPKRNFLHHWLPTCLFHDVGYALEEYYNDHKTEMDDVNTLDLFAQKFGITRRFDYCENREIVKKYYKYRICECKPKAVDHGIIGAMILYDAHMNSYVKKEKMKETAVVVAEKDVTGIDIIQLINLSAETIAKHNMWFADENDTDMIEIYKKYGLQELIPKEDGSNKISFDTNPMLFLLCLLDTIEPIKIYEKIEPSCVIKEVQINLSMNDKHICIEVVDSVGGRIIEKMKSLKGWMNLTVPAGKNEIEFDV